MKWVSSSVFIDHKCISQESYPWCTYLGGDYFIFCVLLLTSLSRLHVCRKHIHDHKGNMLNYEYATWLQGHQSNLKKESSSTKLGLVLLMWFTWTSERFMINRKKRVQVMFIMIMCKSCMWDPSLVKDMEPIGPRYVLLGSSIYDLHLGPLHASVCMFCIK